MPAISAAVRSWGKPGAYRLYRPYRPYRDGAGWDEAGRDPHLSAARFWPRCRGILLRRVIGQPGIPVEAERAVDLGLVMADTCIGARLEGGPAQLIFDLLVALPGPVPEPVDPDNLSQVRDRVRLPASRGPPGRGRLVTGYQVALGGRVAGPTLAPPAAGRRRVPTLPVWRRPRTKSGCARRGKPPVRLPVTGIAGRPRLGCGWRPPGCARPGRTFSYRGVA
jgi:hypothetical protein